MESLLVQFQQIVVLSPKAFLLLHPAIWRTASLSKLISVGKWTLVFTTNESARAHIGSSFFYQKVAGIDDDLVDLKSRQSGLTPSASNSGTDVTSSLCTQEKSFAFICGCLLSFVQGGLPIWATGPLRKTRLRIRLITAWCILTSAANRRMAFTKREQSKDKLSCCRVNNQACRWVLTVVAGDDWQPVGS